MSVTTNEAQGQTEPFQNGSCFCLMSGNESSSSRLSSSLRSPTCASPSSPRSSFVSHSDRTFLRACYRSPHLHPVSLLLAPPPHFTVCSGKRKPLRPGVTSYELDWHPHPRRCDFSCGDGRPISCSSYSCTSEARGSVQEVHAGVSVGGGL